MANKGGWRKKIPPDLPLSKGGACTCFCRATRYNGVRFLVCNDVGMSTITDNEIVSLPRKVLHDFVVEFGKMKKVYEVIDHTLAEKDIQAGKVSVFTDTQKFFDDLDN